VTEQNTTKLLDAIFDKIISNNKVGKEPKVNNESEVLR